MKSTLLVLAFCFTFGLVPLFGQSDFYSKRWSEVYRYELKALPKSALSVVDTIYGKAKHEKNIQQLTKALLYQSKFALSLEENAELIIVQKLKKEINESKTPQRNILESIVATIYWQYFQDNRGTYYQRSRTSEKINAEDFRTWDADAMFQEVHRHFQNSLQNAEQLQKISLSTISDILTQAENSTLYRPTVYDLLAHNALDFYHTSESLITKPIGKFVLNDPRFIDDFENITLSVPDSLSPQLQALKIFQNLLSFHRKVKDTTAYVNLEIERLQLVINQGSFENKIELHKKALTKLKSIYYHHSSSAQLDFELASILYKEGSEYRPTLNPENQFKKKEALELLNKTITNFPKSDGAEKCRILREEIRLSKLELKTERYLPIQTASRILVTYANIDSLNFSAFRIAEDFEAQFYRQKDSVRQAWIENQKPDETWKSALKNLQDYQEHTTEVPVPKLPQGRYLLLSQVPGSDKVQDRIFAYTFVQVTNLAFLESSFSDVDRFQVVDRNTGKPLHNADVHLKTREHYSGIHYMDEHFKTNKDGFIEIKNQHEFSNNIEARIQYQGDQAVFGDYYISEKREQNEEKDDSYSARTFLFTDRSIYRPGQTVYFKGILIKTKGRKSTVVGGEYIEVYFQDTNYKDIDSLRLKTNSFGSFSGEFKLPSSGLTGEYTLYADEDWEDDSRFYDNLENFNYQELEISVEEYKRPTFEASFNPVKETFKLNDTISVKGSAIAYSGAKVTKAKISYHVMRNVRYPHWYYWSGRSSHSDSEEIAFGEGETDNKGEFFIPFAAIPDENISAEEKPIFEYEVTVGVTDVNGETRSATTTVKVGYHTLVATLNASARIDKKIAENTISITTENLNGQYVPSKGSIQIYKLQSPTLPLRSRPWASPDLPIITEDEFKVLFPHDAYSDESDPQKWKKGKAIFHSIFDTEKSKEIKFTVGRSWEMGSYLMELTTTDPNGDVITDMHRFTVFETESKAIADNQLLIFETDKPTYKVGDIATLKIGSASSDISVTIDIERDYKIVKTYVEHLSASTKEIKIPITASMGDGFAIHCSAVNYNAFLTQERTIPIVSETEQMEIEIITFKDKLQPGTKQTWSFEIKGSESIKRETEILASMYDASLDQFKSHGWSFQPVQRHQYYSYYQTDGYNSFGERSFDIRNLPHHYFSIPRQYYDQLDWFGFSITNNYYLKQRYMQRLYSSGIDPNNPSKVTMINDRERKDGHVYGTIRTKDGSVLPGVNVLVKGTTRGTITDMQGNYMIDVDKGDVLAFSFIGYAPAEAKVNRKNTINVLMEEDVTALSEVVVTAMGVAVERKNLSASVGYILSETQESDVLFSANLQGNAAGVQVTGMPGGTAKIMIRGNNSLDGSTEPLYVVDGVIVEASKIDQADLANIQVLKGAAATALYGAKGANGVIIVSTKSGQKKLDEEMAKVSARKDFKETAFFFPHITTDEEGKFRFTFTTPEALTRWKLQLLAHTKDLVTTTKTLQAVTQKELMVTPNAPRFMRVGDEIFFSAKIANLSGKSKEGKVALQISNAVTGESIDPVFQNVVRNQSFKVAAKGSTQVSWKLKVPAHVDAIQYKVVAKAGNFSDGEQNALPILSNRILVTESMPMYVRSGQTKTFTLEKLKAATSSTLQHHQLTLEVTSNPAWYAVQALPYLMEFPHECAEQLFSRYYANALASHIANSNPKIREVFDKWSSSDALISNLEKNEELKSIIIEETPWLRDAQSESEQKKRIALLFDLNKMKDQLTSTEAKLQNMQMSSGGFPWFSGGRYPSRYITQHIASGFGHLKQLKVLAPNENINTLLTKAIAFLDEEIMKDYDELTTQANNIKAQAKTSIEGDKLAKAYFEQKHVSYNQIQYLYMRSFYPDHAPNERLKPIIEYYRNQTDQYWKDFDLYMKGMIALIHYRNKKTNLPTDILKSLKENSIVSEELGMYWKENKAGWYWHESPVETQALLIEAFAEIESHDITLTSEDKKKTIDELRIWLLKNKQTSQWKTTKATTEAVYALLLNGTDWLSLDKQVEVTIGGNKIIPDIKQPETGTGYFKTSWKGEAITPSMSQVTLTKKEEGIAWGGLYWQYFEDLDKITSAETPLQLTKKVFVVKRDDKGELLTEVNTTVPLKVGDLLRIRIELKADRPMEFLHMKDMRASGLEPVDVLSEYKWQEGLGYYQSTKDAATHFFFDYIPQGVYVFEYDLRVNNKGNFSNGITTIQSMYAPEFSSHSEGIRISVD